MNDDKNLAESGPNEVYIEDLVEREDVKGFLFTSWSANTDMGTIAYDPGPSDVEHIGNQKLLGEIAQAVRGKHDSRTG